MPDQMTKKTQHSLKHNKVGELPPIPDKLYFTIGEVSKLCSLQPHVLRYWEQEFQQLKPAKRRGNRRYYTRKDVLLVRQIRQLLYDRGLTIKGARAQFSGAQAKQTTSQRALQFLNETISDLETVLEDLERQ